MPKFEDEGDRQKFFEHQYGNGRYLMNEVPCLLRLDGRSFHSFTHGLQRPFDLRFSNLMIETTKFMVTQTCSSWGYCQSDEISLCWLTSGDTQLFFDGKVQKIVSVTAALASAFFNRKLEEFLPEKLGALPIFDSRVFNVPSEKDAVNYLNWRMLDNVKNSVSMLARAHFGHSVLHNKNQSDMHEMLHTVGVNWADQPHHFKNGTFFRRTQREKVYDGEELERLPEAHAARLNPNLKVLRNVIEKVELTNISKLVNASGVVFKGESPRKVGENDQG